MSLDMSLDMDSFSYFYLNLIDMSNSGFLPPSHLITPGYDPAPPCRAFWVNPAVLCRPLQARSISGVQHTRVILSDLEVSTRYCVQVQINTRNHQPSEKSLRVCESTSNSTDTHTHSHVHQPDTPSDPRSPLIGVQETRLRGRRRWWRSSPWPAPSRWWWWLWFIEQEFPTFCVLKTRCPHT